ncbi:MAG TPA: DUF1592 domain-containing protein [Polyangia bacterium]|nr:DUF1592 domain-containing protein [Polyangia bacterium]
MAVACTGNVGGVGTNGSGGRSGSGGGSASGGTSGTGSTSGSGGGSGTGTGSTSGSGGGSGTGATPGSGGGSATGGTSVPSQPVVDNKAIHRLSNLEYDNTVRDLLHTDPGLGKAFVEEEAQGFDNIATALSMSPRQVEDYFTAARTLSATVFADATLRGRIVTCDPAADATCPEKVVTAFGRRAYRRPLDSDEIKGLVAKYQEARTLGVDALGALQHVVHIVLASPQFLYRIEFDRSLNDIAAHDLSAYELASRLSYALWSSMPDDTLLASAESGKLSQAATLDSEVDRMLADSHSDMLVKNFAAQWFGSRRLPDHVASATIYPAWNADLSASMEREMELYFSEFLRGSLSFADFLTTDMNFVDARLAALYGMPAPSGSGFQRVNNTTDHRRGFLGLAGFLTHTSRETRSSPIIRGVWILNSVWCQELRLPTNLVVEPLPEPAPGDAPTAVRDVLAAHRAAAACAPCHNVIDPVGLSLEHFDGIGRYRDMYETGLAIDTVGSLPGGQMVDGLDSLSTVLAKSSQFLNCAAQKFGTYAMGLTMATANRDQVVASWTAGTPTLKDLIKKTVRHQAFTMRKAEGQ